MAMLLLEKGDYMFSFDLKSGYHHVDIAKEHWKYLGFKCGSLIGPTQLHRQTCSLSHWILFPTQH